MCLIYMTKASSPYKLKFATGPRTSIGITGNILVTNAQVPQHINTTSTQLFYPWIMVHEPYREAWLQVGWMKNNTASTMGGPWVTVSYTNDFQNGAIVISWPSSQYNLTVNTSYTFSIYYQGNGEWSAWIWLYRQGTYQWIMLANPNPNSGGYYYTGVNPTSADCGEEQAEVYDSRAALNQTTFFDIGAPVFQNVSLSINGPWSIWNTQLEVLGQLRNDNAPYHAYWYNDYYYWFAYHQ